MEVRKEIHNLEDRRAWEDVTDMGLMEAGYEGVDRGEVVHDKRETSTVGHFSFYVTFPAIQSKFIVPYLLASTSITSE